MLRFVFGLVGVPWPLAAAKLIRDVDVMEGTSFLPMAAGGQAGAIGFMALVPRGLPTCPPASWSTRFVTSWQAQQGGHCFLHGLQGLSLWSGGTS